MDVKRERQKSELSTITNGSTNEKLNVADAGFGLTVAAGLSVQRHCGQPGVHGGVETEFQVGGKELSSRSQNLLAGAISCTHPAALTCFCAISPYTHRPTLTLPYVAYAIMLGLVGSLLAIFIGACFQFFGTVMAKFGDRVVLRTLVAGVIIAVVVTFVPQVMFAGARQNFPAMINPIPARYGVWLLLLFALC